MNTIIFNFLKFNLFLFLFLEPTCFALSPNNLISIESSTLEIDRIEGLATYLGKVILKQTDKEMLADKMLLYSNTQGKLEKVLAFGHPAKYIGTIKNDALLGEANKITFLPITQEIILEGQAKLTQKQDHFTAPFITYNLKTKIVRSKSLEGVRPTLIFHAS